MRRLFLLLMLCVAPVTAFSGRPVFEKLALDGVISQSEIVIVAEKPKSFATLTSVGKNGCRIESWPVIVREFLYRLDDLPQSKKISVKPQVNLLKVGDTINVTVNPIQLIDCGVRATPGFANGVSFVAEQYASTLGMVDEPPETFIVFIAVKEGRFSVVAQDAIESMLKIEDVRKAIELKKLSAGK